MSRVEPEHPGLNFRFTRDSQNHPSSSAQVKRVRLAPIVAVCAIPLAAFLIINANSKHSDSLNVVPVFSGVWALFALWVILHKGRVGTLGKDPTGMAWLLVGVLNLIAALCTLLVGGALMNP